jgi:hypothetical protein
MEDAVKKMVLALVVADERVHIVQQCSSSTHALPEWRGAEKLVPLAWISETD